MTPNDVLIKSLADSAAFLHRYCDDLTPQEWLHRPTLKANCAAWTVGHLALTDRSACVRFGVTKLPELPDGFEKRFSRDEGCPQAGEFGDVSVVLPTFDVHRKLLIESVGAATPVQLARPLEKPHPRFGNLMEVASFMATHTAMHAGQITIIRRSLGRPPLV
jgi:hypothetical protein